MDKTQYNNFAKIFSEYQTPNDTYRKDMHSFLPPLQDKNILDLGCGDGEDLKFFLESNALSVSGIDVSKKLIEIAKIKAPNAKAKYADFTKKLDFESNFFDIVYSQFAIMHEKNVEFIFNEVHRVLKSGGIFLLLVTHPIRQFLDSTSKDYSTDEVYREVFFDEKVIVDEYTHRFEEYLSSPILSKFDLCKLKEGYFEDEEKFNCDWKYPSYLILKYKKLNNF
jgi:ubiquinone/menaquinone biosynthesis C-methylase UbiE